MRLLCCVVVLVILATGCAGPKRGRAPTRPPAPPISEPAKKEAPPPPVLSPQVGRVEEDRLKQQARTRIAGAERVVKQIDRRKLGKEDQETYVTIQSFLSKAKDALSTNDFLRAANLADKAQVLANEMVRRIM